MRSGGSSSSALDEAGRLREKADRLYERAERFERGHAGEQRTDRLLRALPAGYQVLRDCSIPGSKANVDHIVVGPSGVFLVDSKLYTGRLSLGRGSLWHNQHPMDRVLKTQAWLVEVVAQTLEPLGQVAGPIPLLCVHGAQLPANHFSVDGVEVVGPTALVQRLMSSPVPLAPMVVAAVAERLAEVHSPRQLWTSEPAVAAPPFVAHTSGGTRIRRTATARISRSLQRPMRLPRVDPRPFLAVLAMVLVLVFSDQALHAVNFASTKVGDHMSNAVQDTLEGKQVDAGLPAESGLSARWTCPMGASRWQLLVSLSDPGLATLQWAAAAEGRWSRATVIGRDATILPAVSTSTVLLRAGPPGAESADGPWRMAQTGPTPTTACG